MAGARAVQFDRGCSIRLGLFDSDRAAERAWHAHKLQRDGSVADHQHSPRDRQPRSHVSDAALRPAAAGRPAWPIQLVTPRQLLQPLR